MIKYCKWFPPKGFSAICLFGLIIHNRENGLLERTIRHEKIHARQQLEMLGIPFMIWYGIEWLIRLIQYKDTKQAYYNISFEREAYANEHKLEYLKDRRWYNFLKYLKR